MVGNANLSRTSGDREPLLVFAYSSLAADGLSRDECADMVEQIREINRACEITGVLTFDDGRFQQTIEGRLGVMSPVIAAIVADPRHKRVAVTRYSLQDKRQFDAWRPMGFEQYLGQHERPVARLSGLRKTQAGNVLSLDAYRARRDQFSGK